MTSLLVMKEHLKAFYAKYNIVIQPILRFILGMCAFYCLNTNIGYMTRLKNPLVPLLLSLAGALLPYGAIVFFAGCFMIAHIYAVSFEMALIALVLILIVAILYFGFRPGDCFLMLLTPMAFMMKIPYAVPLLVGLGGSLASVIPVGCGVFIYYMMMYVKQNAGVLTNDTSVDIVQSDYQVRDLQQDHDGDDRHLRGRDSGRVSDPPPVPQLRLEHRHRGGLRGTAAGDLCGGFRVRRVRAHGTALGRNDGFGAAGAGLRFLYFFCGLQQDGVCAV